MYQTFGPQPSSLGRSRHWCESVCFWLGFNLTLLLSHNNSQKSNTNNNINLNHLYLPLFPFKHGNQSWRFKPWGWWHDSEFGGRCNTHHNPWARSDWLSVNEQGIQGLGKLNFAYVYEYNSHSLKWIQDYQTFFWKMVPLRWTLQDLLFSGWMSPPTFDTKLLRYSFFRHMW